MANLNRLKVVLAEQQKQENGLQSKLGSPTVLSVNGAAIRFSQTLKRLMI